MRWQEDPEPEDENLYAKVRGRGKRDAAGANLGPADRCQKRMFSSLRLAPWTGSSKIRNFGLFSSFFFFFDIFTLVLKAGICFICRQKSHLKWAASKAR